MSSLWIMSIVVVVDSIYPKACFILLRAVLLDYTAVHSVSGGAQPHPYTNRHTEQKQGSKSPFDSQHLHALFIFETFPEVPPVMQSGRKWVCTLTCEPNKLPTGCCFYSY